MVNRCLDIGAVSFVVPGAIPVLGLQIPVVNGLLAAHLLGHGADTAALNLAPGNSRTRIVGSPSFLSGYAELSSDGYLQTDVPETAAMTLLAFGKRKVTATLARFISNFATSSSAGVTLGVNASASNIVSVVARDGVGFNTATTSNADSWVAASSIIATDITTTGKNYPSPANANSSSAGTRQVNGGGKLRIGAGYSANAISQMNSALIFNRALNSTEIATLAEWQRQYAAECGII